MLWKKIICISIFCFPFISNAESYQNNQFSSSITNNSVLQYLPLKQEYSDTYRLATQGNAQAQLKFAQYYSNLGNKNYRLYKEEFYWYKKAAEQGLPEAQVQVAELYSRTLPFYPNIDEALKWLLKAVNQDYAKAQEYLAWVYLGDWGDEAKNLENDAEALKWFNKAIETNLKNLNKQDSQQLYDLSNFYFRASELTPDPKEKQLLKAKSIDFLKQSVALGSYEAAESLAKRSDYLPLNHQKLLYQKAFELLVKKAQLGDPKAQIKLADLYKEQDSSFSYFFQPERIKPFVHEIKYDEERIKNNPSKVFYWYNEAYKNGDKTVTDELKSMYVLGNGTEKKFLKALELQKELSMGRLENLYYLATMYLDERNPLKEDKKSFEILKYISEDYHRGLSDTTDQGYLYDHEKYFIAASQAKLGSYYLHGIGTTQDYQKAMYWLNKAASQNDSTAQYWLGEVYYLGHGVVQNYKTAFDWYTKAVSTNKQDSDTQYRLGYMYEHGQGITKNYEKALVHYKVAADLQHEPSKKALINLTQIMYK